MTQITIPTVLNWNSFTAAFNSFIWLYNNKRDYDKVRIMFAPWIVRFGYEPVRDFIVRYCNYLMDGAIMTSANYDIIGYKPQYYDAKYAMKYILEILDEDFEN
jgi:hypothetical protein